MGALVVGLSANLLAQPSLGTQLWAYASGNPIGGSPALAPDGTVYFANGTLFAITNAGSNKWSFPLGYASGYSSPAVAADGTIYISSGSLYAVNPGGSQKWAYPAGSEKGSPAIGLDGTVYIHGYHLLYAISTGGAMIWSNRIGGTYEFASPSVAPDRSIYAPSRENQTQFAMSELNENVPIVT